MKTRTIARLLVIISFGLLFLSPSLQAQGNHPFQNGIGTSSFPFQISSANDLLTLANLVNSGNTVYNARNIYYSLESNISLSSYGANYNSGKGWIPIGHDSQHPFVANFVGNNRTISDLYINNPSSGADSYEYTGLFGWMNGGTVKNLNVNNANITGYSHVGGIAGSVSYNHGLGKVGEILNCRFLGTVAGAGNHVGGLVGLNYEGRIILSYLTGSVVGKNIVGGIAGYSYSGTLRDCAALNQSVTATDAGANLARVACTASGLGATPFSGNIAFNDMIVTANSVPKNIVNNSNGIDGASRSGLDLRYANGFPSGLTTSPWVFANGRLPGLGSAVTKPAYLVYILATLNVQRNGAPWTNHGKSFSIRLNNNPSISYPLNGSSGTLTAVVRQSGTWQVYDGATYTGVNIVTNDVEGAAMLNYFTVNYNVVNGGTVTGSTIGATYDGAAIASGTTVLGGKQLVVTAAGGTGASSFAYTWSGAGANNQTTPSISLSLLDRRVDAICVVSGAHNVQFSTVGGNGTLKATVDGVTIASGASLPQGKDVLFTTEPNNGYRVKEWTDNGALVNGTAATYTISGIAADHNVTVEYEHISYAVSFSTVNNLGTLTASVGGTSIPSGASVPHGSAVVFTATPPAGYIVKEWKLNGATVQGNTSLGYTLQSISAAATVSVEFEIATYAITHSVASAAETGTLQASSGGLPVNSGALLPHGSTVDFIAAPAANYRIRRWRDNNSTVNGTNAAYQITELSAAHNVTVEFELETYAVAFSVDGGNGTIKAEVGSSIITNNAQVEHGSNVVFTATPNTGYRVKEWKKDGIVVTGNTGLTYTVSNLSAAVNVTVVYEMASYPVTFSSTNTALGSLSARIGASTLYSPANVLHGSNIAFTAVPEPGNQVMEWRINGNLPVPNNKTNNYTLQNLSEAANVTVAFEPLTYIVTFSAPGGNGSVTATYNAAPVSSGQALQHGGVLVLNAAPANATYRVKEWKVNGAVVNGANATYTISNLSEAHTITVDFELVDYPVTFSVVGGNGGITAMVGGSPITQGAQVQHGSAVTFNASPNAGYRVKEWKNGVATVNGTASAYTVSNLSGPLSVTVEFEYVQFPVNFSAGANGGLTATVDGNTITTGTLVPQGKNVVFTASPTENYRVSRWLLNSNPVNDNKNQSYTVTALSAATTVAVEFELVDYQISFSAPGGNGTIAATANNAVITSPATVEHGKTLVFTATPSDANFRIKEWRDNGAQVNGTNASYTINNLSGTHNVTVEFDYVTYPVTFNVVNGNGGLTATVNAQPITSVAAVRRGNNIVFTAAPAAGYKVKEWRLDQNVVSGNTSNSYTLNNLTAAATVTVEFERITYAVTFNVTGSNGTIAATVNGAIISSGDLVPSGRNVVFTATPASGFRVSEWRSGGSVVANNKTNTYTLSNVQAATAVTVSFEADTYPVGFSVTGSAVSGGTLAATVDGAEIANNAQVLRGKSVVFTATPPNNCTRVKEWRLNGSVIQGNTSASYTLSNHSAAANVTVEFENAPCSTVTFSVQGGNGTLTARVDDVAITTGTSVPHGKNIVFRATPTSGYRVKEWKNGNTVVSGNTSNNYTLSNLSQPATVTVEFELLPPTHHLVSFSVASGNGTLTATVDGVAISSGASVPVGKNVIFTAQPATGNHIVEWIHNGTKTNGTNTGFTINNLSASQNVSVAFDVNTYAVNFSRVNPSGGSLSATVEGTSITTGAHVQHGKSVVFAVIPNAGYRVKEWKLGVNIVGDKSNNYTLNNVTAAATVTVEFELIPYALTFSVTPNVGGTISATANNVGVVSGGTVLHGQRVVFTVVPANGYRVKEWKDNTETVNGTASTYTINSYTVAHNVTVTFEPITYAVTFQATNSNGSLAATANGASILTDAQVNHGASVVFTATPAQNYRIKEWRNGASIVNETAGTYTINNLTSAVNVTVAFEPDVFPVTFGVTGANGTLAATVNGSGISSGADVLRGRNIQFEASPANGYNVKGWTVNGTPLSENTSNSFTLPNLQSVADVRVEFEITTLLLTYSALGGNGTISATANGVAVASNTEVDYDKTVVFTTVPASGYRVKEWKDNGATVNGVNASYTINNFRQAHTVTVEFEPIPYRITFNTLNAFGSLSAMVDNEPVSSGAMVANTKNVVFTAEPNRGYRVQEWTRGGAAVSGNTSNTYTLSGFTTNTAVTVAFEAINHTVTFSAGANGGIAATVNGTGILSGAQVREGRTIMFMAMPSAGFSVKEWRVDNQVVAGYTAAYYELEDLSGTTNVTVAFEPIVLMLKYSVAGGEGTLNATVGGTFIETDKLVEHGSSVVFTAVPGADYRIKEWKDNGMTVNGDNNMYTINDFSMAHTVTVTFEMLSYAVVFNTVDNNGTLTATANGEPIQSGEQALIGSRILFTAVPNENCRVTEWTDNGIAVNGVALEYVLENLKANHTVTVNIVPVEWQVTFGVEGGNGALAAMVHQASIASGSRIRQGVEIEFLASPSIGYSVKSWQVNGEILPGYTADRYTLNLSEDVHLIVTYEPVVLMLRYGVVGENGKLTATVDGANVETDRLLDYGKSVVFTATPDEGYRIREWKDNGAIVNGDNARYTIPNFFRAHNVTVEFEKITYPVTFEVVNGNGAIAAMMENNVLNSPASLPHGSTIVFTAEPDEGYVVKEWTLNNTAVANNKTNVYELTDLHRAVTVTVEFETATYPVIFSVVGGNGSLSASVGGVVNIQSNTLTPHGRTIIFTTIPDNDYRVKEWKHNGEIVHEHTSDVYTIILTAAATIEVEFEIIPIAIAEIDLAIGVTGMEYSQTLYAVDEFAVSWSMVSGSLPDGLNLHSNGTISGMPVEAGVFNFVVKAEINIRSASQQFVLMVERGIGANVSAPTARDITLNSVALNAVPAPDGQTVQYAIHSSGNANAANLLWQDELTFSNLTPLATYYAYARSKENANYLAGAASVSTAIVTEIIDEPDEPEAPPLTGYVKEGRLVVRGLTQGKVWNVYNTSGVLIHSGIANSEEMEIYLRTLSMYIIQTGKRIVKVSNHGQ